MGRRLLRAQPSETNICGAPSSDPLCFYHWAEFKEEKTAVSGDFFIDSTLTRLLLSSYCDNVLDHFRPWFCPQDIKL